MQLKNTRGWMKQPIKIAVHAKYFAIVLCMLGSTRGSGGGYYADSWSNASGWKGVSQQHPPAGTEVPTYDAADYYTYTPEAEPAHYTPPTNLQDVWENYLPSLAGPLPPFLSADKMHDELKMLEGDDESLTPADEAEAMELEEEHSGASTNGNENGDTMEQEGETEAQRAKRVRIRRKPREWKKTVDPHVLEQATVAQLEKVIQKNKEVLDEFQKKHEDDLQNQTNCAEGSLEWIRAIRQILENTRRSLEKSGEGEKGDGETRKVLEWIKRAVSRYDEELGERTEFLTKATKKWIPQYLTTLDVISQRGEQVLALLKKKTSTKAECFKVVKNTGVNADVYRMILTLLKKGLEDLANKAKLGDIRRNENVSINIIRSRNISPSNREKAKGCVRHPENHIRNTFFYWIISAFYYDCVKCYYLKDRKARKEGKPFPPFAINLSVMQEKLGKIRHRIDNCGKCGLPNTCDEQKQRGQIERLRAAVAAKMEEVEAIGDAYGYISERMERSEQTTAVDPVFYMEAAEAYIKSKAAEEGGEAEVEKVLRTLYRTMKESGKAESVTRKDENPKANPKQKPKPEKEPKDNKSRYKLVRQWLDLSGQQAAAMKTNLDFLLAET